MKFQSEWINDNWSQIIYDNIDPKMLEVIPADIEKYCAEFRELNTDQRKRFYIVLFSALAKFESSFNPRATFIEGFTDAKGKKVISTGLFQVSVESLGGYGIKVTPEQLLDAQTNIKAMLVVASRWIIKDKCIASDAAPWKGMSRYWSPFRKEARKSVISKKTMALKFTTEVDTMGIYEKLYATAKAEMGVKEKPGSAQEKRILQYHKTTTLKALTDETPWCASFVNWVVIECNLKGTNSASARSWIKWGVELKKPIRGCVVVFTRTGGGHVGFYHSEDANNIYVLGGNQSNSTNISAYPRTRLLGYRGV